MKEEAYPKLEAGTAVAYGRFFKLREVASQRFPTIWDIPIRESPYEFVRAQLRRAGDKALVLDFGCGVQKTLQATLGLSDAHYHTCDSDSSGTFTYQALSDIPAELQYEVVVANQVIEHLGFEDALNAIIELGRHVRVGGIIVVGVPNAQHPTRQWADPTHVTAWNYGSVCALISLAGLESTLVARTNKTLGIPWWQRPLVNMMAKAFRMDWCDTVYVVGLRRSE